MIVQGFIVVLASMERRKDPNARCIYIHTYTYIHTHAIPQRSVEKTLRRNVLRGANKRLEEGGTINDAQFLPGFR